MADASYKKASNSKLLIFITHLWKESTVRSKVFRREEIVFCDFCVTCYSLETVFEVILGFLQVDAWNMNTIPKSSRLPVAHRARPSSSGHDGSGQREYGFNFSREIESARPRHCREHFNHFPHTHTNKCMARKQVCAQTPSFSPALFIERFCICICFYLHAPSTSDPEIHSATQIDFT